MITKSYNYLQQFIIKIYGNTEAYREFIFNIQTLKKDYLNYLGKPNEITDCIKIYNQMKTSKYLAVSNSRELLETIISILDNDFKNWIENEGAYKFIREATKHQEDLIQKTIITQIENGLLRKGFLSSSIKREEQLLDDKRPDIVVTSYGFIGPIVIEIKRFDNREIYNETERNKYRKKFLQYLKATHSEYGLYLAFQINGKYTKDKYLPLLESVYKNDLNIVIKGYNCINTL